MTFRIRHEWSRPGLLPVVNGSKVVGVCKMQTCPHCETLRVEEAGDVRFIRREADEQKRVMRVEPACVSRSVPFRPPI